MDRGTKSRDDSFRLNKSSAEALQMKTLRVAVATSAVLALVAGIGAAGGIYWGVYNVAATRPHSQLAYWVLQTAARRSIEQRAKGITAPDLSRPEMISRGLAVFRDKCVQCHGAPGIAPADFAKGLEPAAPPLEQRGREWSSATLYWATRHGIKMTAMPAWEFRMDDADIWAVVAFIRLLPTLSAAQYRTMAQRQGPVSEYLPDSRSSSQSGDPERGKLALHQYACNQCHEIPGVSGPPAMVGPPLRGLAKQVYIAGVLRNSMSNMLLWIEHPQSVKPLSAMPDMGVAQSHARDMAAYLYSLP
jgi:mono/diheme cytochrome c family protein